jgi:hypothetical protein
VRVPDAFGGLVVSAGRPVGTRLAPLADRESLVEWRALVPRGPLLVRSDAEGPGAVREAGRLGRLGELWMDVPRLQAEEALEVLIAGAARLVLWHGRADADLVDVVGASAVIGWDGATPWADAAAVAAAHDVPVLASAQPPSEPGPVEVFRVEAGPEPWRLAVRRVHEPAAAAAPGAEAE